MNTPHDRKLRTHLFLLLPAIWSITASALIPQTALSLPVGYYHVLPPVQGSVSLAGASDTGSIAAGMVSVGNTRLMFLWEPFLGSRLVDLPPNHELSQVNAISGDGSVVAGKLDPGTFGQTQAFRWSESIGFNTLGTLSSDTFDESVAFGISFNGSVIVGESDTPDGRRAFKWTAQNGMTNLGTRGSSNPFSDPWSSAAAVSPDGSIIAGTTTVTGMSAGQMASWKSTGGWQVLGSLPEGVRSAGGHDLTDDGSIVVGYNQGLGFDGIYWSQQTGLRALPKLTGSPDYWFYKADKISGDGRLITGFLNRDNGGEAIAWERRNGEYIPNLLTDLMIQRGLDLRGWMIRSVTSISPDGRVLAGNAFDAQGRTRGFVAVMPVPEPRAMALWILVLLAASFRRFCSYWACAQRSGCP